jgi:signal transduction histidine kinase
MAPAGGPWVSRRAADRGRRLSPSTRRIDWRCAKEGTLDDLVGLRDLRRLKLIGLAAPAVFLVALEAFQLGILDNLASPPLSNAVAALIGVVGALGFGLLIFFHIEQAQRHILSQNRDLGVVNAVSVAVQGELDVQSVLRAALDEIVRSTGAGEATLTVQGLDPESAPGRELVVTSPSLVGDALTGPEHIVDVPLATGAATIGHLRLRVPQPSVGNLPSPPALHTVGHQLASAIQIGELVGDLQRRKLEGHTLYQSLLQISNQAPLPGVLAAIVGGARDRLAADESRICLTDRVLRTFEGDQDLSGELADGIVCDAASTEAHATAGTPDAETRRHGCAIGEPGDYASTIRVPVWTPGELLGDLWLGRRAGAPFTDRDRRYLATLAGIAAIAITAARLRENERQGAILAERDRIARELHDSLAQVLGSTHLRLRTILARSDLADLPRVSGELEDLATVAEEAYRDVREAILGLREASKTRGLLEALQAYLDRYAQQSGIKVHLETATEAEPALSTNAEIQVIRVIQEALTNIRKHARATSANVRLTDSQAGQGLTIVIEDDGRGFDPAATLVHHDGGYGLQTMRERMELAGGSLRVDSSPGHGTRVIAIIPQNRRVQAAGILADHR